MGLVGVAAQLVGVEAHVARAASDQSAQQPGLIVQVARAPLGVVSADSLSRLEDGVVEDGRAGDLDPLVPESAPLGGRATPAAVGRGVRGDGLGLVEVDATDVGLVGENPAQRGVPPLGLAGGSGDLLGVEGSHDVTD